MIFVYTGDGKGKTTAAIGQAIRAIGYGKKVLTVQFIKSPKWPSGEEKMALNFRPFFKIKKFGEGFVLPKSDLRKHKAAAENGWLYAKKAIESGKWDLIILDEINVAVDLQLLKISSIINFLKKNKDSFIILTGRNAPKEFIEIADLATEMKEVRHSYQKGILAKKGVEY